jgi:hypothetical protein
VFVSLAKAIAELPLDGGLIVMDSTTEQAQERTRARLLAELLPRLHHIERVGQVVLESRAMSDKHDRRTRDRLRQSRKITSELRVEHARKAHAPLVWLPDFVAGAFLAARYHAEPEPWNILSAAHAVEVIHLS